MALSRPLERAEAGIGLDAQLGQGLDLRGRQVEEARSVGRRPLARRLRHALDEVPHLVLEPLGRHVAGPQGVVVALAGGDGRDLLGVQMCADLGLSRPRARELGAARLAGRRPGQQVSRRHAAAAAQLVEAHQPVERAVRARAAHGGRVVGLDGHRHHELSAPAASHLSAVLPRRSGFAPRGGPAARPQPASARGGAAAGRCARGRRECR